METKLWHRGVLALAVLALFWVLVPETGAQEKKWSSISTNELKAKLDRGESFTMVNVLPRIIHDVKYIEGVP